MDESDDVTPDSAPAAAATDVPMLSHEELMDEAEHFLKDVFSYLATNPNTGKRDVKALPRRVNGPAEHTPGTKPLVAFPDQRFAPYSPSMRPTPKVENRRAWSPEKPRRPSSTGGADAYL